MDRLYADLCRFDAADWRRAIDTLGSEIHEIDRNATKIWFAFYPLQLHQALEQSADVVATVRTLGLMGRWRLADQIDTSHTFLYGHQFWFEAKRAVLEYTSGPVPPSSLDLGMQVQEASARVAAAAGVPCEHVIGITAVALRTLQQVGAPALAGARGGVVAAGNYAGLSADEVLRLRERRRSRSVLGFFGGGARRQ